MSTGISVEEDGDAWLLAALPHEFDLARRKELINAGYQHYKQDGRTDTDSFLEDIQVFGISAFNGMPFEAVQEEPLHTDPRVLTTIATMAASAVKLHDRYRELTDGYADPDMELLNQVRTLWIHHLQLRVTSLAASGDFGLLQRIGEHVYQRRAEDKIGPAPGRVVTDVTTVDTLDQPAVEIPLEHYSRKCEVRNDRGEIVTFVQDGHAYVPISDLREKMLETAERAFDVHLDTQFDKLLTPRQKNWLVNKTDSIQDRIDQLFMGQEHDKLFDTGADTAPEIVRVFMNAIANAEPHKARFNDFLTSEELLELIWDHNVHPAYQGAVDGLNSPTGVSKRLVEHEDCKYLEVDRSDRMNQFAFGNPHRKGKAIEVDRPEDILELPCMSNIDDYLMEEKPVRWILYTMARLLMSLENDFAMEELIDFYSRYPWFDRDTTRYQLEYERRHGEDYMPINCHNDNENFTTFCIGLDECEYYIYSSLPLKDEIFED